MDNLGCRQKGKRVRRDFVKNNWILQLHGQCSSNVTFCDEYCFCDFPVNVERATKSCWHTYVLKSYLKNCKDLNHIKVKMISTHNATHNTTQDKTITIVRKQFSCCLTLEKLNSEWWIARWLRSDLMGNTLIFFFLFLT